MLNKNSEKNKRTLFIILSVFIVATVALAIWSRRDHAARNGSPTSAETQPLDPGQEHGKSNEVKLSPDALAAAGIETVEVRKRQIIPSLKFTGTVEANQQQTQQVTPLVSGRVEMVKAVLGDRVRAGQILAVVASPEMAEMHGKLHEAETRFDLAEKTYARVQRAENRVSVIQAKARLDEAEATLRRTKKLTEFGVGAGKDLIAAEAAYKSAKAEYDYQSNISLNKEVQQARADVETARVEVQHFRDSLRALGTPEPVGIHNDRGHDISRVALFAPVSGTVTERLVNAGAGIEAGKPMFTISNIATVWVIANVPESQIGRLRIGTPAEVRAAALAEPIKGRIAYIAPALNEDTRTARVRIEAANRKERLKFGMFVEVLFQTNDSAATEEAIAIPATAIQRIGDRAVVFIPKAAQAGHFEAREVEVGGTVDGYTRISNGLNAGERVVTQGSFTLKTQLMKGELGEEH